MPATFPGGVHNFGAAHVDDVDEIIHAYSINDLGAEVVAMETWLRANLITARTVHPLTIASPARAYSADGGPYASSYADPAWFLDGAGVVHWTGMLDTRGITSGTEILSGAPAPADGKIHQFPALGYQEGAAGVGADTYSMGTSAGWVNRGGTYAPAAISYGLDGWVRLTGSLQPQSTYGYGSYITSIVKPVDFAWHFFYAHDTDGNGPPIQLLLDQYGNLLTGPQCNNVNAVAGHCYTLEGIQFKAALPLSWSVMANGNGRLDGLIPQGTTQAGNSGTAGPGRVSLDGISYYAGL